MLNVSLPVFREGWEWGLSFIRHIFVALAYSLIAAACAMALLGCALLDEVSARQEERSAMAGELHDLRMSVGEVTAEPCRAREEVALIGDALEGSGDRSPQPLARDVDHLVAEVRALQSLVDGLSGGKPSASRRRSAPETPLALTAATDEGPMSRSIAPVAGGLRDGAPDTRSLERALDRHGIDLIAEKIETEPMLLELLDYQIGFGQGYLFGEPRRGRGG